MNSKRTCIGRIIVEDENKCRVSPRVQGTDPSMLRTLKQESRDRYPNSNIMTKSDIRWAMQRQLRRTSWCLFGVFNLAEMWMAGGMPYGSMLFWTQKCVGRIDAVVDSAAHFAA